jgi:hypothetical protein
MKNITKILLIPLFLSAFILLVSFGGQKAEWKGKIEVKNGVKVVKNPKKPMYGEDVFIIEEELSFGDNEEDENYMFSEISHITVDNDGRIYILDRRESHVKLFDQEGKYVRTIGRKGQGPGELNDPIFVYFPRNELLVTQFERLSFFSPEGEFLRSILMKKESPTRARCDSHGNIIGTDTVFDFENPYTFYHVLKTYDSEIEPIKELVRIKVHRKRGVVTRFGPNIYMTVDDEDNIIFGYSKDYELQIFNPEGDLIKKIMREYDPAEVTEEEKEESTQGRLSITKFQIPKYHPAFVRFVHDEAGRLYVQSYEKGEGFNVYYHDVFDRDGRYIAKIQLKRAPVIFRDGKLYSLEEDEDGYQYVKRYKVTWKY